MFYGFFLAADQPSLLFVPIVFAVLTLWCSCRSCACGRSPARGYVTPADFVRGRYGSSLLALLVAITEIVATMPYIALQLVGLEAVLRSMGFNASGFLGHLPLLIAFVKDILIYVVILVAVIYLPIKLGGWDTIFGSADEKFAATPAPADGILLGSNNQLQYATLALGSALAGGRPGHPARLGHGVTRPVR